MSVWVVLGLAVGLALDCFSVAIATGIGLQRLRVAHALKMAVFFGGFQAVMPVIGWLAGISLRASIAAYDHWVAFVLLTAIGVKMIWETRAEKKMATLNPENTGLLLLLAIGTSIDALVVGVSLSFLDVSIVIPVLIIGAVTFVLTLAGAYIGGRIGHWFEGRIEILGGVVMILIGMKILANHFFGRGL
ncbi:MAG: manganese efflux pump MntP family protein [Kiritimatiellaeota bacterium]|nr:manganese efflux pump MntP family protein [Kiritimatiellota bacterium]